MPGAVSGSGGERLYEGLSVSMVEDLAIADLLKLAFNAEGARHPNASKKVLFMALSFQSS